MRWNIVKYKHVKAASPKELESKVQEMLDAGWVLCGTPFPALEEFYQCVHTPDMVEESQPSEGLTVDDIATLSLLGRGRYPRRRW